MRNDEIQINEAKARLQRAGFVGYQQTYSSWSSLSEKKNYYNDVLDKMARDFPQFKSALTTLLGVFPDDIRTSALLKRCAECENEILFIKRGIENFSYYNTSISIGLNKTKQLKVKQNIENKKNYENAVAQFNRLENQSFWTSGDYEKAKNDYKYLVNTFKELSDYRNTDSFVEQCQQKYTEALRKEEEARIKASYDNAVAQFNRLENQTFETSGDYEKAESDYKYLVNTFKKLATYRSTYSLVEQCQEKIKECNLKYTEALRKEKEARIKASYDNAVAQFNRLENQAFETSGDYEKAENDYKYLVNTFKELSDYRNTDSFVEQCQEKIKECNFKYTEALRKEEEARIKSSYDNAISDFYKLNNEIASDENGYKKQSDDYNSLADMFLGLKDYEDAKKLYDQCKTKYEEFNVLYIKAVEYRERIELERRLKEKSRKIRVRIMKIIVFATVVLLVVGYGLYMGWFAFVFNQNVTIPDTINVIEEGEFAGKQLTSIDISNSVTSIGNNAFRRNGLTSVVIPDSVASIGENAFSNNWLTSITIGSNVTLGNNVFGSDFENIYNNNGMNEGTYRRTRIRGREWSMWHSNFRYENNGGNITITGYDGSGGTVMIPGTINAIEEGEFAGKQQTSIDISNSVTFISNDAFRRNRLTSVVIPNSVTSIGENAFANNRLTSITIGSNVTIGNDAFGSDFETIYNNNGMGAGTYRRSKTRSREWSIWYGNFRYENNGWNITITGYDETGGVVMIPAGINGNPVTAIGAQVFMNKNLSSATIPNSVTVIGSEAFRNNQLTSVNIGNRVITIGDSAFDENLLTSVTIPNSVTIIGKNAFCCNQLTSLTLGNSVRSIGQHAFTGSGTIRKNQLTRIIIPDSVTTIGVGAFGDTVTSIRIGANVTLDAGGNGQIGILGRGTGFNSAYANNNRRAGTYTRPNANSTTWTRR